MLDIEMEIRVGMRRRTVSNRALHRKNVGSRRLREFPKENLQRRVVSSVAILEPVRLR
jgi:hypothetical protein